MMFTELQTVFVEEMCNAGCIDLHIQNRLRSQICDFLLLILFNSSIKLPQLAGVR